MGPPRCGIGAGELVSTGAVTLQPARQLRPRGSPWSVPEPSWSAPACTAGPACATAWLRDIVEHGSVTALRLVTRDPLGSYELYVLRIAAAQERQLKAEVNA